EVIVAQSHASQAIESSRQALSAEQAACALPADGTEVDQAACDAALAGVQQAQDVVSDVQDALAKALGGLSSVLGQALGQVQSQSNARTAATDQVVQTEQTSTPSNGAGQTVTAAQLAAHQARL